MQDEKEYKYYKVGITYHRLGEFPLTITHIGPGTKLRHDIELMIYKPSLAQIDQIENSIKRKLVYPSTEEEFNNHLEQVKIKLHTKI